MDDNTRDRDGSDHSVDPLDQEKDHSQECSLLLSHKCDYSVDVLFC
jgi:hypothetical protein